MACSRVGRSDATFATTSPAALRLAPAQIVFTAAGMPGVVAIRVRTGAGAIPGFDRVLTVRDFRREG